MDAHILSTPEMQAAAKEGEGKAEDRRCKEGKTNRGRLIRPPDASRHLFLYFHLNRQKLWKQCLHVKRRGPWFLISSGEKHGRAADPLAGASPPPPEHSPPLRWCLFPIPRNFAQNGNQLAHCRVRWTIHTCQVAGFLKTKGFCR